MTGVEMLISRNRPRGALCKRPTALARGTLAQRQAPRLVQFAAGTRGSGPAARVLRDELRKELGVCSAGVEGRDVVVEFPAAAREQLAIANRNLLQRLQAIGGEPR